MSVIQNPIVILDGLTKIYNKKIVVNNIKLEIPKGCFGLLGPNGAGKSTLILLILGLIHSTNGRVYLMGREVSGKLGDISYYIGYLPENPGFFPNFTARDHLDFCTKMKRESKVNEIQTDILLRWCGLKEEYWDKKTRTFSRGMLQRLGLAQAFTGNPKIVFLDEPLSNIDPLGRDDLIRKLREKRDRGISIIISSHIVQEVEQLVDNVAFIDRGKIIENDNLLHLSQKYGFTEYEITCPNDSIKNLEEIYHYLNKFNNELHLSPILLNNKIILKTTKIISIIKILSQTEISNYLRPIEGTLIKLYKKIILR